MTDLLMEIATLQTAELRERLAKTRITIRNAKTAIEEEESQARTALLARFGGDTKQIGANELQREDRHRAEYATRQAWITAKADLARASDDADLIQAVLDGRLDKVTEDRLVADNLRTAAIHRWLNVAEKESVRVAATVTAGALS